MLPAAYQLPAATVLLIGGTVSCFFGYRLFRIVLAIFGFILGALVASSFFSASNTWGMLAAALIGGLGGAGVPFEQRDSSPIELAQGGELIDRRRSSSHPCAGKVTNSMPARASQMTDAGRAAQMPLSDLRARCLTAWVGSANDQAHRHGCMPHRG